MFTSMTARISTNTYCLAKTQRFSRWSENSVGRVTHEREAPTDILQLVTRDPDFRVEGIVVVRRRHGDRIYSWLAEMQMKLFRPIDEKWCHYWPIDERDVIMRLHISSFGSC